MLAEAGIQLYGGVTGDADKAAADLLSEKLSFDPEVSCTHHEGQHDGGCTCGDCAR